jgi:hypothetical protein
MASSRLLTLKNGFTVAAAVVWRLRDLEDRGATFERLDGGRFRVVPPSLLTVADIAFLHAHRDEARALLDYDADALREPL